MNEDFSTYEQIDEFLKGNLKGNELSNFQQKMESDSEFSETVRAQKVVNEMVMTKHLADLKGKMQLDLQNNSFNNKTNYLKYGFGLAGIMVATTLAIWQWNGNEEPKTSLPEQPKAIVKIEQKAIEPIQENSKEELKQEGKSEMPKSTNVIKEISKPANSVSESQIEVEKEPELSIRNVEATSIKEPEKVAKQTIDCLIKQWKINIETSPTCLGKSEGSILIFDREKHLYSIDEGKYFSTKKEFNTLAQGAYHLIAKDENGCEYNTETEVKSKKCKTLEDLVFNPNLGAWHVLTKDNLDSEIEIRDKAGRLVWKKIFSSSDLQEWDGRNNEGQLVPIGLYCFHIVYSNGDSKEGYISVMY
jgi:hypothetical protein